MISVGGIGRVASFAMRAKTIRINTAMSRPVIRPGHTDFFLGVGVGAGGHGLAVSVCAVESVVVAVDGDPGFVPTVEAACSDVDVFLVGVGLAFCLGQAQGSHAPFAKNAMVIAFSASVVVSVFMIFTSPFAKIMAATSCDGFPATCSHPSCSFKLLARNIACAASISSFFPQRGFVVAAAGVDRPVASSAQPRHL